MDVSIKNIKFVKAEDLMVPISVDSYGKVVSHNIEAIVATKDAMIKGDFIFQASLFNEKTNIKDYENAIKNLFRER
jgi:hypothetical protein